MDDTGSISARRAAEQAARDSFGRLVAILAVQTRDIAAAEDALGDALVSALAVWPERGVPDIRRPGLSPQHATGFETRRVPGRCAAWPNLKSSDASRTALRCRHCRMNGYA